MLHAASDIGSFMSKKYILVVDGSAWSRQVVRITLKHSDYEVIEASDEREGLAVLDNLHIDLIICDPDLPNAAESGFIDAARQKDSCRNTPILMLTAQRSANEMHSNRTVMTDARISKPFQPSHLLAVVARLLPA